MTNHIYPLDDTVVTLRQFLYISTTHIIIQSHWNGPYIRMRRVSYSPKMIEIDAWVSGYSDGTLKIFPK